VVRVEGEFSHIYEIKKSKFIVHLFPYKQFDSVMKRLKDEHPKGRHFVYAYRYLNAFDQVVENSSDDGEPKGTSGKPSLAVLQGHELINSAVIIVRYFGGIRLGTGGLVRAYGTSVNEVLDRARLEPFVKEERYTFFVEYAHFSKIEYLLNSEQIEVEQKNFHAQQIEVHVQTSKEKFERLVGQSGRFIVLA
jgi:uncharacterized YigZ family protein